MTNEQILLTVQCIAKRNKSWVEVSNAVFDPELGLLATEFRTRKELKCFIESPKYLEIQKIILGLDRREDAHDHVSYFTDDYGPGSG